MTPERLAEIRKQFAEADGKTTCDWSVFELLDAIESAQAEIAQLSEARRVVAEPREEEADELSELYAAKGMDERECFLAGIAWAQTNIQSIPAARVLKDGEVGVSVEDADLFVQWYHALKDMNPLFLDPPDVAAYDRIKLVRSTQAKGVEG